MIRTFDFIQAGIDGLESEHLSVDEAMRRIGEELCGMAGTYRRLAVLFAYVEKNGGDVSSIKSNTAIFIRLVAHGQLHPDLLPKFIGMPGLLKRIAQLPMPDQAHIASGKELEVICSANESDCLLVRPEDLRREQVSLLFDGKHLRSRQEQIAYLKRRVREVIRLPSIPMTTIERGKAVINGVPYSRRQIATILAALENQ